MEPRKRISLLLSIILVSSMLVVIASTLGRGTGSSAGVKRVKVLRRKDQLHIKPRAEEIAASQEGPRERKFKNREFKDIPVAVTKVSKLQSDTWYKDLEIEVKNISSKPIYFILAYLEFPDVPESGDAVFGIALEFGKRGNIDYRKDADPKDPHLNPGDKFTFTIPEKIGTGLRAQHEDTPELMKKLELHISVVSFGDGTGIVAERLSERKRSHSDVKKNHHSGRPGKSASVEPPPQDGCGSCSRYVMEDQPTVICYYANGDECPSRLATTSPERPCSRVRELPFPCGRGVRCHNDEIYPSEYCPGSSPTPTPTPEPSPTPTPCPDGSFNQNPNGDCPSNSYKNNGCCVCQVRNTDCSGFGQGDQCLWVENLCDCYNYLGTCADHPLPSPAPTPNPTPNPNPPPGGGGGGGGGCTEYWWVYYESYDGGLTYTEVSRSYAGCW
jgi:hypothetical protein